MIIPTQTPAEPAAAESANQTEPGEWIGKIIAQLKREIADEHEAVDRGWIAIHEETAMWLVHTLEAVNVHLSHQEIFRSRQFASSARNKIAQQETNRKADETIAALQAKVDALERDRDRLDWMDKNGRRIQHATGFRGEPDGWVFVGADGMHQDADSLREAIDAALDAARKEAE